MRGTWWLFLFLLLSGCVGPIAKPWPSEQRGGANVPTGALDFGWKLSGDRAVAPLQVFSDASRTWLQWVPGQVLPVILGSTEQGEQVVSYLRQGPYAIIEGHWPALSFRSANQLARARRISSRAEKTVEPIVAARPEARPSMPFFSVSHSDRHLRQALTRWAGLSGWRFEAEHWVVDVDIPLSASASFSEDFVSSVQALIASTELSDRPLQPCFYSNQVLRVVSLAEPCDRTLGDGTST